MNMTYDVNAYDASGELKESASFCFVDKRESLDAAMACAERLAKRNARVEVMNFWVTVWATDMPIK